MGRFVVEDGLGPTARARASATRLRIPQLSARRKEILDVTQVDEGQDLAHPHVRVLRRRLRKVLAETEGDVLSHRHRVEQGPALEDHGDAAANLQQPRLVQIGEVLAVDGDPAGVGTDQGDHVPQGDRLAGPRSPQDGHRLPGRHPEVEPPKDPVGAVGLLDPVPLDERGRGAHSSFPSARPMSPRELRRAPRPAAPRASASRRRRSRGRVPPGGGRRGAGEPRPLPATHDRARPPGLARGRARRPGRPGSGPVRPPTRCPTGTRARRSVSSRLRKRRFRSRMPASSVSITETVQFSSRGFARHG